MSTRGVSTTQNCHRHPHVHMIVPGGGFSLDKARWVAPLQLPRACQCTGARVSRQDAGDAHGCTRQRPIDVLNTHAGLTEKRTFKRFIAALRRIHWVVHCKAPFAAPEQVLRYLSRYTRRVAISNRRLVAADNTSTAFRWKDHRINGPGRWKTMRFLMHVLPK